MTYRDDLEALRARHAALEAQVAENTRQRDEVGRMVDEAAARARLPVLADIRIASPCKADWNTMTGDDRARLCHHCDKQVFNLSELTRDEAEALIRDKAGQLCAQYYRRADGTILLADCSIGAASKRKRRVLVAGSAVFAAGAGLAAMFASHGTPNEPAAVEVHIDTETVATHASSTALDTTIESIKAIKIDDQMLTPMRGQVAVVRYEVPEQTALPPVDEKISPPGRDNH